MSGTDKSTLEITVITTGLNGNGGAPAQLNKLGEAAGKAEPKVKSLLDTVEKLMNQQKSATAVAQQYTQAIQGSRAGLGASTASTNTLANATTQLAKAMLELTTGLTAVESRARTSNTAMNLHTAGMKDAHAAARGLAGSLGALWMTYGNLVPMAAGIAIGASFKGIVKEGAAVENVLSSIAVKSESSMASLSDMRQAVLELGKGIYGPLEVAKAMETLVLAGLDAKQAVTGAYDALNLATVGGTSIDKAAYTLVQVGTAMGYTSNSFSTIADVIAKTAAVSMSSVESLSEAFKSASTVGKVYGVSLQDLAVQLAALSNLGIQGSAAGTSVKNYYKELASMSDKVRNLLKNDLKIDPKELKDAQGNFLGILQVVGKLETGLGRLTESAQKDAIQILSNERGMKTAVELRDLYNEKIKEGGAAATNALAELRKEIGDAGGMAAIGAARAALSAQNQMMSVANTLKSTFVEVFKDIEPQLTLVARGLRDAFSSGEFKAGLQQMATTLANFFLAIVQNLPIIVKFAEVLLAVKTGMIAGSIVMALASAFTAVATAMSAAAAGALTLSVAFPPLAIAIGLAAAAMALYVFWKEKGVDASVANAANAQSTQFIENLQKENERIARSNELLMKGVDAKKAYARASEEAAVVDIKTNHDKGINELKSQQEKAMAELPEAARNAIPGYVSSGKDPMSSQARKAVELARLVSKAEADKASAVQNAEKTIAESRRLGAENDRLTQEQIAKRNKEFSKTQTGTAVVTGKVPKERAGANPADKENEEYARRMEQMTVGIALAKEEAAGYRELGGEYSKLTEGGKLVLKYQYELDLINRQQVDSVNLLRKANLEKLLVEAQALEFEQKLTQFQKDKVASGEALQKDTDNRIAGINKEAETIQLKIAAYGMLKGASDAMIAADLAMQKSQLEGAGVTGQVLVDLQREIDARTALAAAKGQLATLQNNTDALDTINKALDPGKALQFGDAFKSAFGEVGKAIDKATKSFDEYGKKQKATEAGRKALANVTDLKQRATAEAALNAKSKKDELDMYSDMAGAAKGFFKEKTLAYKVFNALEIGFRVGSMAMATVQYEQEMAFLATKTALENAAVIEAMAMDGLYTTESVANSGIRGGASLAAGIMKVFEQMGVYGFIGAAALIAFAAAWGFGGSGGGGGVPSVPLSEQRQKTQGTGTVLGSEDKKSESIANSISHLADVADITLPYTSKMLITLKNIEAGIGGMANFVARSTGLRGTQADQNALGVGASSGTWGFSSSKTELQDSGILFGNQNVGSAMNGVNASSYADVHKESSSWWGLSKSSSDQEQLGRLNGDLEKQITMTIGDMVGSITAAAQSLGKSGPMVTQQLKDMQLGIERISLKGLSGDDLVKELQAVFSQLGDRMSESVLSGMQDFQKVGEGYMETIMRVASGVEQAKQALAELGLTAVGLYDVVNKQGDVSAEVVRQTLVGQESTKIMVQRWNEWGYTVINGPMNGIGEIISTLSGTASDLIATYKQLIDIRAQMKGTGLGENLDRAWVIGAGGLDKLGTGVTDFVDGMFSDAEKVAMKSTKMTESFKALGFALPATAVAFRELVQSVAASGNNELAGKLIVLSGGFNDLQSGLKDLASATNDAAKAAADAAQQAADDAKAAREQMLTDAHTNLTDAYNKESQTLEDTKTKFEDFAKSLRTFRDGLMTGADSPLTPGGKYSETSAQYASTLALAQTGDKDAISKFQTMAQNFLTASKAYNASGDAYISDFNKVMTDSGALADIADHQVDVATASLDALNKQVAGLMDVKAATLSVQVAIMQLYDAMVLNKDTSKYDAMSGSLMQQYAGQSTPGEISMYSSMMGNGASYQMIADAITKAYPAATANANGSADALTTSENKNYQLGLASNSANQDLVDELKGLRDEVTQLRAEQQQQTQALIGANYDAHESAASTVVDGVGDALSQSARVAQVKPALN